MAQNKGNSAKFKLSQKLLFVVMAIALAILLVAFYLFFVGSTLTGGSTQSKDYGTAMILAVFSSIVLSMASITFQAGAATRANVDVAPKMITTIECAGCSSKTTREFQRGDYVFKELDACTKCGGKQLITAIYREIVEKEKKYPV